MGNVGRKSVRSNSRRRRRRMPDDFFRSGVLFAIFGVVTTLFGRRILPGRMQSGLVSVRLFCIFAEGKLRLGRTKPRQIRFASGMHTALYHLNIFAMNNFIYHNPTKLVFGKGQIARLPKLIPAGKRIMLTFGGGSVKRNGVYDQVVAALEGRDFVEFWGILPSRPCAKPLHWVRNRRSISCWRSAADRLSTVRNSSLRDFSTTAMRGISCARGRPKRPCRWLRSSPWRLRAPR